MSEGAGQKISESEKITINLGYIDLGRIDLLVRDGFYANRTDFIRTAIRNQLAAQAEDLKGSMARQRYELGLVRLTRGDLERLKAEDAMLDLRVVGFAALADDIDPALARATIRSIAVLGHLQIGRELRTALADRIR